MLPRLLRAEVSEVEIVKITNAVRHKIPYLRQYPEGSVIRLVEINMKTPVTLSHSSPLPQGAAAEVFKIRPEVLRMYDKEFRKRTTDRQARLRAKVVETQDDRLDRWLDVHVQ